MRIQKLIPCVLATVLCATLSMGSQAGSTLRFSTGNCGQVDSQVELSPVPRPRAGISIPAQQNVVILSEQGDWVEVSPIGDDALSMCPLVETNPIYMGWVHKKDFKKLYSEHRMATIEGPAQLSEKINGKSVRKIPGDLSVTILKSNKDWHLVSLFPIERYDLYKGVQLRGWIEKKYIKGLVRLSPQSVLKTLTLKQGKYNGFGKSWDASEVCTSEDVSSVHFFDTQNIKVPVVRLCHLSINLFFASGQLLNAQVSAKPGSNTTSLELLSEALKKHTL